MDRVPAKTFEDLIVWQKSHRAVLRIYRLSANFPKTEMYGLTQQLRRSAVSVPANVAEGFKRRGRTDKARYLNIAQGSLEETRYYLILARDLGYSSDPQLLSDLEEVGRLLGAYSRTLLSPTS